MRRSAVITEPQRRKTWTSCARPSSAGCKRKGPTGNLAFANRYHAVDDLHKQSMGIPVPPREASEIIGFSYVRAESRTIVDDLFRGATMDWKPGILPKLADNKFGLSLNAADAAKNAASLKP